MWWGRNGEDKREKVKRVMGRVEDRVGRYKREGGKMTDLDRLESPPQAGTTGLGSPDVTTCSEVGRLYQRACESYEARLGCVDRESKEELGRRDVPQARSPGQHG